MPVRFYISRDPRTGAERGFENNFEREAILIIAKRFWKAYKYAPTDYALIANVENPPIDFVILSNTGMGVAELKDCSSPFQGTEESPWVYLDTGQPVKAGANFANPFQQVKFYNNRVFFDLKKFASDNPESLPEWLASGDFYRGAALFFTDQPVDISLVQLAGRRPWFSMRPMHEVNEWAYTLTFGKGYQLDAGQIDLLARAFFRTELWLEIDAHLDQNELYGYLWHIEEGYKKDRDLLNQDVVTIGRGNDMTLPVDERFTTVSRRHAVIRRTPQSVLIFDDGSANGTWVNGQGVDRALGCKLNSGDRIVLGTLSEEGKAGEDACEMEYEQALGVHELGKTKVMKTL